MTSDSNNKSLGNLQAFTSAEQVLDNLPDGVTIQDREFTVIFQNQAMRKSFGDQVGVKCYAAYEHRDETCEDCGVARAFASGKSVLVLRTAFDADGGTSYWENSCFPIFDSEGRIVAGVEICRNVTDRVSLESEVKDRNIELGQANRKLKQQALELAEMLQNLERETARRKQAEVELRHAQKLQAVGQLAAGIAHEINTPAQFINDSLQYLADSFRAELELMAKYQQMLVTLTYSPKQENFLQTLKEAEEAADHDYNKENVPVAFELALDGIERISTIVKAMKEFAHPSYREKVSVDLNHALETTLLIAKCEYKNVAEIETDFEQLPPVWCHLEDINQVFLSLIVNAAHAIAEVGGTSGEKGRIRVATRLEGNNVRIEFSDTGCGIPEEIQDRVFEPFFTTKEIGSGSGQGLAIAHSIVVDKHNGALTFESTADKGTTFAVILPING